MFNNNFISLFKNTNMFINKIDQTVQNLKL